MADDNKKFNLLENCKKKTQKYILAEIFTKNQEKWITKREVEKQMVLNWCLREIDDNTKLTKNEIIDSATYVPGDIQRDLRLFFEKFEKYGMEKKEKDKSSNTELSYKWTPISMHRLKTLVHPEARNIFKTDADINKFLTSKKHKCEMCGACKSDNQTLRLAVDHWRAHSKYNIDNSDIAVLLCEQCNNIHHNYDASKIAVKYKDNISIVKNWVKKEKDIRSYGFMPNKDDIEIQRINKQIIDEHHKELNPLHENFWENLF